ncbi:MAG: tail fiber domain-containing protein, partial [Bacteroidia bacterium]
RDTLILPTGAVDGYFLRSDATGKASWTAPDLPVILQDTDNDTKIRVETSPDEDIIRFDTKGAERMVIDSTGNVGIGIAAPTSALHVIGNIRTSPSLFFLDDYIEMGGSTIKLHSTLSPASLKFQVGSATGIEINDQGFMGVGTSPVAGTRLKVSGRIDASSLVLNQFRLESGRIKVVSTGNTIMLGDSAGHNDDFSDNHNIFIGHASGKQSQTGERNISIGHQAGYHNDGDGNIFIGYQAAYNETGENNRLFIENTSSSSPLVYGEFDNDLLRTNSKLEVRDYFQKLGSSTNEGDVYVADYELKLVNAGQAHWSVRNDQTTGRFEIATTSASAVPGITGVNRMVLLPNGDTGIGTNSPGVKFQVGENGDGTIARANAWNTFSDLRWKKDIEEINNPLEKIEALNGYYYKWKEGDDQNIQVGLIAQEVEAVLPEIVSNDENGYKSVDYSKLSALFIEGIQEQQRVIERKEEEIEELKVALKAVLERLEKLENH